jgi:hypothetical protein
MSSISELNKEEILSRADKSATLDDINADEEIDDKEVEEKISKIMITDEFKENVIKYIKVDDCVKNKQSEVRELKNQLKPIEESIIAYLDKLNQTTIEITDGNLRKTETKTKKPINKTYYT